MPFGKPIPFNFARSCLRFYAMQHPPILEQLETRAVRSRRNNSSKWTDCKCFANSNDADDNWLMLVFLRFTLAYTRTYSTHKYTHNIHTCSRYYPDDHNEPTHSIQSLMIYTLKIIIWESVFLYLSFWTQCSLLLNGRDNLCMYHPIKYDLYCILLYIAFLCSPLSFLYSCSNKSFN